MPGRLVLVRHGPSAFVPDATFVDRAGLLRWRDAYDAAGIDTASRPSAELIQLTRDARHILASDLARARESAERLAPDRPVLASPLVAESRLSVPHWPTRLPLGVWGTLIHLSWGLRIARGTDVVRSEQARAESAAAWIEGLTADGSTAVVVTHGVFRRILGKHLVANGWDNTGRRGGYSYWSAWSFVRRSR